jgi:DNA-directed RNA polymerase alpha subunit
MSTQKKQKIFSALALNKKALELLKKTPIHLVEFANANPEQVGGNISNDTEGLQGKLANQEIRKANKILGTSRRENTTNLQNSTENLILANQKAKAKLLSKYVFNKFFICCKESRIESPNSFYGCFYIGPFTESLSQTLAHNIRRTLLSQLSGFAITAVEIDGVLHKFSNLPGIKETVLDIICNLQNLVFKEAINSSFALALKKNNTITLQQLEFTAYVRVRGPGIVTAADILLPAGLQCVNPNQYICTLAEDGSLNIKLYISSGQGQNYIKQKQKNLDLSDIKQNFLVETYTGTNNSMDQSLLGDNNYLLTNSKKNKIYLDSVFMPVTKVNTIVQANDKCTDDLLENNLEFKFIQNSGFASGTEANPQPDYFQKNKEMVTSPAEIKPSADFDTTFNTSFLNFELINKKASYTRSKTKKQVNTFFTTHNLQGLADSEAEGLQSLLTELKAPPELVNQYTELSSKNNVAGTNILNKKLNNDHSTQRLSADSIKEQVVVLTSQQPNKIIGSPLSQKKQSHIVVEIWTNGSIHPREALKNSLQFLSNTFVTLENVKMLGSMFKSDVTYAKVLKNSNK